MVSIEAGASTNTTAELQIPDPAGPCSRHRVRPAAGRALVERALDMLAQEFTASGKAEQFELLKPWLLGEVATLSQFDAAGRLGMTEGAVKVAVHRLRKRFRALVTAEIAQTMDDPSQVQEELRYLLDVLSQA